MSDKLADWTKGAEAIVYQSCGACGAVQYFHRSFCAACGAPDPATEARQRRRDGLCDVAGVPRRDAGDARARSLQHRAGRYGRRAFA